jgi:hypothetical protein
MPLKAQPSVLQPRKPVEILRCNRRHGPVRLVKAACSVDSDPGELRRRHE